MLWHIIIPAAAGAEAAGVSAGLWGQVLYMYTAACRGTQVWLRWLGRKRKRCTKAGETNERHQIGRNAIGAWPYSDRNTPVHRLYNTLSRCGQYIGRGRPKDAVLLGDYLQRTSYY